MWSIALFRFTAWATPMGIAISTERISDRPPSTRSRGSSVPNSESTVRLNWNEYPRFPCRSLSRNSQYWYHTGRHVLLHVFGVVGQRLLLLVGRPGDRLVDHRGALRVVEAPVVGHRARRVERLTGGQEVRRVDPPSAPVLGRPAAVGLGRLAG